MIHQQAKDLFIPREFPFGIRYHEENFIVRKINVKDLRPSTQRPEIVEKYKSILSEEKPVDPIWCSVGRKMKDGNIQRFYHKYVEIKDGNHRAQAAKELGLKQIDAVLPESHWEVYESN